MAKIISFSNQKGGVAAGLALKGKKTLLIDMDPQGNATTGLGFSKNELANSVYNVLIDELPAASAIQKTTLENLDILPASIDLAGAEVELVYLKNREKRLREKISAVANNYDFIMIDCHPSLGVLRIKALSA